MTTPSTAVSYHGLKTIESFYTLKLLRGVQPKDRVKFSFISRTIMFTTERKL